MIGYLIKRPIAVITISIAFIFLGIVSLFHIPTSLMPDVDIPEITVQIDYPNHNAREIENNIVRPLRNQLLQVSHLSNIQTETYDGTARIKLSFEYGTKIHYAFIETNEKIDASLNYLPKELSRPKVIKASATDIPVLNLVVYPKTNANYLQFSSFIKQVLKKRIEQLPEIAIADISGYDQQEILLEINKDMLQQTGISIEKIINTIKQSNIETGDFIIQNGIYQYRFKFKNQLNSIDDIKNLTLMHKGKIYSIKQLANVKRKPQIKKGMIDFNGNKAVVISVIKQRGAKISELKQKLNQLIAQFKTDYPDLQFTVTNDQSKLLSVSLSNLTQSLVLGTLLAVIILFFFVRNYQTPLLIALSIPTSLLVSFLFLQLLHISINIISLSGLILGVGLMIDNAIIVIDNILQKLENHNSFEAVVKGTTEVISPLISSALTTVSVFVPLIFLSGMAGALFYDQAMSVSIGLLASILVSIILIPVLFYLFLSTKKRFSTAGQPKLYRVFEQMSDFFNRKKSLVLMTALLGIFLIVLVKILPQHKLPKITQTDTLVQIDWGKPIHLSTNNNLIDSILKQMPEVENYIAYIGKQDFLLQKDVNNEMNKTVLYVQTKTSKDLEHFQSKWKKIAKNYPELTCVFAPADNIFNYMFGKNDKDTHLKIYSKNHLELPPIDSLSLILNQIGLQNEALPVKPVMQINILHRQLLFYNVSYTNLLQQLKSLFNEKYIDQLKNEKEFIPIQLAYNKTDIINKLNNFFILNDNKNRIPLKNLISIRQTREYKKIPADRKGEFVKITLPDTIENVQLQKRIKKLNKNTNYFISINNNQSVKTNNELYFSILISLLLLYLIMAAQFESFWQPLIILLEIPIDIGFALLFLWLFGSSVNIMSLIGIIVMSGIVVNDSILKIHTINLLRKKGLNIEEAIHKASVLRLKPILMTSLTTIFAMIPLLFMNGLGAELQKPLALVIIGGLGFGTFISLFFIPLAYYYFNSWFKKLAI